MATILLIEDALELAQVIIRELNAEGYRTLHAIDGATGLALHQSQIADLIILDWMLPGGMDGVAMLRYLRQRDATPVLMLTARTEEIDRVIGLEVGADDYLTKPFGMRELIARVRALLRRVELIRQTMADDRLEQDIIQQGGLTLWPDAHRATLDTNPLELTPTEFSLLYLMLRQSGRAFSRRYLIDTIWGETYIEGDRAVDSTVMRLRKKLGKCGDRLETVRGVGYRWRETDQRP